MRQDWNDYRNSLLERVGHTSPLSCLQLQEQDG